MKLTSLLLSCALLATATAQAQTSNWIIDSLSVGANYASNIYYSLETGSKKVVAANNWHIGFSTSRTNAAMITNSAENGVTLYRLAADTSLFGTDLKQALDSTIVTSSFPYYNSNTTWETGAFNQGNTGGFNYGWGDYRMVDHNVYGNKIFGMIIGSDTFQIFIEKKLTAATLANSPKTIFKYANIDGTNVVTDTFEAGTADFTGQNFAYYNFMTKQSVSREPKTAEWDFLFTSYNDDDIIADSTWYKVFGLLTNKKTSVAKYVVENFAAHDTLNYQTLPLVYSDSINAIGRSWKIGTRATNDSNSYFVKAQSGNIWQVVFTAHTSGLDTANPGLVVLQKRLVYEVPDTSTSIKNIDVLNQLVIAPNPVTNGQTYLLTDASKNIDNATLSITDINGRVISQKQTQIKAGFYQMPIQVGHLNKGLYIISVAAEGWNKSTKMVIK